ncbi:MAG: hypothetical protein ABWX81_07150 [Pseudolabrys sp.]
MRQLMIFAVVLVVLGGVAARYADQAVSSPPQQTGAAGLRAARTDDVRTQPDA